MGNILLNYFEGFLKTSSLREDINQRCIYFSSGEHLVQQRKTICEFREYFLIVIRFRSRSGSQFSRRFVSPVLAMGPNYL